MEAKITNKSGWIFIKKFKRVDEIPLECSESLQRAFEYSKVICDIDRSSESLESFVGASRAPFYIARNSLGQYALISIKYRYSIEAIDISIFIEEKTSPRSFYELFGICHCILAREALEKGWKHFYYDVSSPVGIRYSCNTYKDKFKIFNIYEGYNICFVERTQKELEEYSRKLDEFKSY